MIKKYGSVVNILLIVILAVITTKAMQINTEKEKMSELYTGETTMLFAQTGFEPEQYVDAVEELDQIEGVTASNSYMDTNGERQNTLYIDQVYNDQYLANLQIDGEHFNIDDFKIEFTKNTTLPVIVSLEYATENKLKVGSQTTIENFLPSACELYSTASSTIGASDGTSVLNSEINNGELCKSDQTYEYLDNDNGFAEIPVKVIGIFDNAENSFPGFPIENHGQIDVLAPRFIVKNSNQHLYDVENYRQGNFVVTKSGIQLFINYDEISESELNQQIQELEQQFGVTFTLDKATDWKMVEIEDTIKLYNQALVNYLFGGVVILVLWLLQMYYRLLAFQYDAAVFTLLGVPRSKIISFQFKRSLPIALVVLIVIAIVGLYLKMLIIMFAYYLLIYSLELVIFSLYTFKLTKGNINQLLTGGEL